MDIPKWQYDEMKSTGVDYSNIFEVQAYDDQMSRIRDIGTESKEVISTLALPPAATLLEIGTGTGTFAVEAAGYYSRVLAVDVSATMIEYARRKALGKGIRNIEFYQAGFLTYEHDREPLDAVVSQIALHHLPDFWKLIALKKVHGMLKDGGRFYLRDIVFSFEPDHYRSFFDQWVDGLRQAAGERMAVDTETSIKDEFYTWDWIMEGLLTRAGFDIKKKKYTDGFMAVYLCEK
ncbi:MAG: class I SAM-dependent methyltransferase [Firmicutes bacterium]|nr:class I SAM-dependent methyltransferase [Bacillota bacterium]